MRHKRLQSDALRASRGGRIVNFRNRAWGIALAATATVGGAWACSGVGPFGKPVVFGNQTNIVIWDEAHQTEHFIRNANFKSGADNFGFIAPTPAKPQLSEASDRAFYTLAALQPVPQFRGAFGGAGGMAMAKKAVEVQVIQEADVAGYHATTLKCPDAHAINDWMNAHGYVSTPEVEKWAQRYCSRGWFLTAFKVIDKTKLAASTGTVRMSFKTENPYNPFYVPKSNIPINGGSTLRVYFVSVGDYDAHIGHGSQIWQIPQWTAQIPEAQGALLAKQAELPFDAIPDNCQVETFMDYNFPRPAKDDIYFVKRPIATATKNPDENPNRPTTPFAVLTVIASMGLLSVFRRRRSVV